MVIAFRNCKLEIKFKHSKKVHNLFIFVKKSDLKLNQ